MKIFYITSAIIALLIIGFIILNLAEQDTLDADLFGNVKQSIGEGMFFKTLKIIPNQNNKYPNHCKGLEQILVQTHTWMMIPGPVFEVCIVKDANNKILYYDVYGNIKK